MPRRARRAPRRPLALSWLALAVLGATPASAQSFAGRVVEGGPAKHPIAAVAVALLDSAGHAVATASTDGEGVFYLAAPSPGSYSLAFTRPGGAPHTVPPRVVAATDDVQAEYVVPADPPPVVGPGTRGRTEYFDFEVEQPVVPVRGNRLPRYPREAMHDRLEAELLVQFVVDTTGRAVPSTFRVLRDNGGPAFVQAVRDALPTWRFFPARTHGRAVKQLVQLPVNFGFEGTPWASPPDIGNPWTAKP